MRNAISMNINEKPKVIAADCFSDGVLIAFSDGRYGMYATESLHAALSGTRPLFEQESDRITVVGERAK